MFEGAACIKKQQKNGTIFPVRISPQNALKVRFGTVFWA